MLAEVDAVDVIREVRRVAGLTQHALATAARTTQSTIAAYESGRKQPTTGTLDRIVRAGGVELSWAVVRCTPYRAMTLADLAAALRAADDDLGRRLLTLEFVQEFGGVQSEARHALLVQRPAPTGDARWDALVGALAEHLAFHHELAYPQWAEEPDRFLDQWWFPIDTPAARAAAIAHAPAAFARRGVFVERRDLLRT